jgi:hypothetical protein
VHLLYLDDSGSVKNASDTYLVLAGISAFERRPYYLCQELDRLAEKVWPDSPTTIEFRGVDIMSGRKHWRGVDKAKRPQILKDALSIVGQRRRDICIWGAAIHKATVSPEDPVEYAFEQLCNRFDRMLLRLHRQGRTERGLIILDKSTYETSLQVLTSEFRVGGHRWGRISNMADVPLFVDSRATRMVQFADMVAFAIRRKYERADSTYFDVIKNAFDSEGGVIHGLVHYKPREQECDCPVCLQATK